MADPQHSDIAICLIEPDMPGNFGAALRLCACLGLALHIIEPCGFPIDHKKIRRSGMDYVSKARLKQHKDYSAFFSYAEEKRHRLFLASTKATTSYLDLVYEPGDMLLFGSESKGAPEIFFQKAHFVMGISMAAGMRSMNVINAAAMICGEALRQVE